MSSKYGIIIPIIMKDTDAPHFFSFSGWLWKLKSLDFKTAINNIAYILIIGDQNENCEIFNRSKEKETVETIIKFSEQYDIPCGNLTDDICTPIKKNKSLGVRNSIDMLFQLFNQENLQQKFLQHLGKIEDEYEVQQWLILEGNSKFGTLTFPKKIFRNGSSDYPKWTYTLGQKAFKVFVPIKENSIFKKEIREQRRSYLNLTQLLVT